METEMLTQCTNPRDGMVQSACANFAQQKDMLDVALPDVAVTNQWLMVYNWYICVTCIRTLYAS